MKKLLKIQKHLLTWWVALVAGLLLSGCGGATGWNADPASSGADPQVCNKSICFDVEVADTPEKKITGLMNRESLAEDAGMIFVNESPAYMQMHMLNTLIPLDMIWIAEDGEVIYMKEFAAPCPPEDWANNECQKFGPPAGTLAKYVLEINGNAARKAGIFEGIKLDVFGVNG